MERTITLTVTTGHTDIPPMTLSIRIRASVIWA